MHRFLVLAFLLAWSLGGNAQSGGKAPRIGYFVPPGPAGCKPDDRFKAFSDGLRESGYTPGRNIIVNMHCYGSAGEMRKAIAAAVAAREDVLVVSSPAAAMAARAATGEVPIVCMSCGDPVDNGLVANLAKPGGNLTGLASLSAELVGKRLELIREIAPRAKRIAALLNPDNPGTRANIAAFDAASRTLGFDIVRVEFRGPADFDAAFQAAAAAGAEVVLVQDDPFSFAARAKIGELTLKHRLPTVAGLVDIADAGGLVAYGPDRFDLYRRSAGFVDRILKGAKPANMPFEQASKFDLVVNLNTADALGIKLPPALVLRANRTLR